MPGWVSLHVSFDQISQHCQHSATPISDGNFFVKATTMSTPTIHPLSGKCFYSFSFSSNVPLILLIAFPTWSQSKRVIENRKRVIENRNFANSCSTYGNYLVSFYPRSDLIVSFYLCNAYALVFRLTSPIIEYSISSPHVFF